jgi:branched-chain amino acid transport system substrate-binding protein
MGELLALTGRLPLVGQRILIGSEDGVYEVNHNGGVMGRQLKPVQADTGGDPVDAVTAWHQMQLSSPVFVSGPTSLEIDGVATLINQAKVVDFTYGGSLSMDNNPNKYVWRPSPSDSTQVAAMAAYAISKQYMNCAIMMEDTANSFSQVAPLTADYTKLGGHVVATEKLEPHQASYRTEVNQAFSTGTKPDCVFISADTQTTSAMFAAVKEFNDFVPFIGDDTYPAPEMVKAIGAATDAKWVVGMNQSAWASGAYNEYVAVQKIVAPTQPPNSAMEYGFDGITIAALAMTDAKSTDPTVWVNHIMTVTGDETAQECSSYASCVSLLNGGKKIDYEGAAGPDDFNQYHSVFAGWDALQYNGSGGYTTVGTVTAAQISTVLS